MSSITFQKQDLVSLIDHHIALLERFKIADEAPFSIVYFSLISASEVDTISVFKKILRQTDALFQSNNSFVVVLPGTDWSGATELLSGIQEFLDQSKQDNIVSFPEDGKEAKTLLKKLEELIEDNCSERIELL